MSRLGRRLLPFLLGGVLLVLFVNLGFWQLRRADEKAAWQARYTASAPPKPVSDAAQFPDGARVQVQGTWLAAHSVLLDNRLYQKRPGFHVLTPLRLASGDVVLVNRGWIASTGSRQQLPQAVTPNGQVVLSGLAIVPAQGFSLGESTAEPNVWQQVDLKRLAREVRAPVATVWILQDRGADDGLVRDWPLPEFGVAKHYGYAAQWFSFALLALGLTAWFGWRGRRQ